ncbi:MAG: hypothetical protein ABIK94_06755 [candidate division WOR-3 bacterium]
MKRYIFFLSLFIFPTLFAQYSFELRCIDDTFRYLFPNSFASYRFQMKNNGTLPDSYRLKIEVIESVPGWEYEICARGRCVPPGAALVFSLSPGEVDTTIVAHIFTSNTQGRAKITVSCRSFGDTTLERRQNLYAQVGSAIGEVSKVIFSSFSSSPRYYSLDGRIYLRSSKGWGIYFLPKERRKVLMIGE